MHQATLAKQREKTRVGAWYSLWYDNLEKGSFWDTVANDFGEPIPIRYKPLLPGGTFGRYDSGDEAVIQFHIEEITKAGIDFLIFDQTNNIDVTNAEGRPWIHENSLKTAQTIQKWNEAGMVKKKTYKVKSVLKSFHYLNFFFCLYIYIYFFFLFLFFTGIRPCTIVEGAGRVKV